MYWDVAHVLHQLPYYFSLLDSSIVVVSLEYIHESVLERRLLRDGNLQKTREHKRLTLNKTEAVERLMTHRVVVVEQPAPVLLNVAHIVPVLCVASNVTDDGHQRVATLSVILLDQLRDSIRPGLSRPPRGGFSLHLRHRRVDVVCVGEQPIRSSTEAKAITCQCSPLWPIYNIPLDVIVCRLQSC